MIPVKEVMTRNVITFREDTPVEEIASTLTSKRITGAPVVANEGHVVGIVSETDVFSKKGKTAREIMSPRVISRMTDSVKLCAFSDRPIDDLVSGIGTLQLQVGA